MDSTSTRLMKDAIEEGLAEALADEAPAEPSLKDFLNAGMPTWLALAAWQQMNISTADEGVLDRKAALNEWGKFIQRYAARRQELRTP